MHVNEHVSSVLSVNQFGTYSRLFFVYGTIQTHQLSDPGSGALETRAHVDPVFFKFMGFLVKNGQNSRLAQLLWGWRPRLQNPGSQLAPIGKQNVSTGCIILLQAADICSCSVVPRTLQTDCGSVLSHDVIMDFLLVQYSIHTQHDV